MDCGNAFALPNLTSSCCIRNLIHCLQLNCWNAQNGGRFRITGVWCAKRDCGALNNLPGPQASGIYSSVRHYADAPAIKSEEQDPLKRIFFNMMKKYKTFLSELTKSKITLDPDDPKAVSDYKTFIDSIRKKVGVPSKTQKLQMLIDREAALAPDMKSFYKSLPKIKARFGITEQYDGDKLMVEAVEKVEKKIGRVLVRGDKEGMALLKKEFEVVNKALGVDPSKMKDVENEANLAFAKAELIHMKDEVVNTIETHKKR
ncbi:hypothetical protein L7F22_014416 [Adiantum nelumboides]|nr:hypothetical protein [Adiantum nelumboides]